MRKVVVYFGLLIAICVMITFFIGINLSVPGYRGDNTEHFDGKRFRNLESAKPLSFFDVLGWRLKRVDPKWPTWVENKTYPLPAKTINDDTAFSVTFINHATVLIQLPGVNILTDPIWSDRASPFSWVGPKRVRAPGLRLDQLPPIDVILLSHNHYDHMDIATLKKLQQKFNPLIITGLGNDLYLKKQGLQHVRVLDWWDKINIKSGVPIISVPAQHFSGRGFFDKNKTLWVGFLIRSPKGWIYFAGDTAMGPHFSKILDKYGSPYLSLLPVGAYEPRDFMRTSHLNPDDAVQAFKILGSKYAIGLHYETFSGLTDEPWGDVYNKLEIALKKYHITESSFSMMGFGQSCFFSNTMTCNQPLAD